MGTDSAVRVSKVNGVKKLMEQGRFAVNALWFKTDFGLTTNSFVQVMSKGSVAARIQDDAFRAILVTERYFSRKRLRDLCGEYRVIDRRVV